MTLLRVLGLALTAAACGDGDRARLASAETPSREEHVALGGSFVSGDSATLRRLLHTDLIVQPPAPDSARRGGDAITYLLELAVHSEVTGSRFVPRSVAAEGPFVVERGIWLMESGGRTLRSPYLLRWRTGAGRWRVVLWRWGAFR